MPHSKLNGKPPRAAIQALKGRPDLADQFDARYGKGSAESHLRRAFGRTTPAPPARRRDVDALRNDPSTAPAFENKYGPGSAQLFLLAEMIDKLDALHAHMTRPRRMRTIVNDQGEVTGVEADES